MIRNVHNEAQMSDNFSAALQNSSERGVELN